MNHVDKRVAQASIYLLNTIGIVLSALVNRGMLGQEDIDEINRSMGQDVFVIGGPYAEEE